MEFAVVHVGGWAITGQLIIASLGRLIAQQAVDEHDVRVVLMDSFTGYLSALPASDQAVVQIHRW